MEVKYYTAVEVDIVRNTKRIRSIHFTAYFPDRLKPYETVTGVDRRLYNNYSPAERIIYKIKR